GLEDARQLDRPMLELQALSHSALLSFVRARAIAEQRAREAIELARAHGWEDTIPSAATAYAALAGVTLWRGPLAEAEGWLDLAELVLRRFAEATTAMMLYGTRALIESVRGRHEAAITAQRATESIERRLAMRHILARRSQALTLEMLVRVGETDLAQRALDDMDEDARATSAMRVVQA